MSDTNQKKKLTLDDPVGAENIEKLEQLQNVEINTAMQLLALRQDEVRLLAAARRVEDERHRIFEGLLMERGLPPGTPSTIDATTGKISLVSPGGAQPPAPAAKA